MGKATADSQAGVACSCSSRERNHRRHAEGNTVACFQRLLRPARQQHRTLVKSPDSHRIHNRGQHGK